ncbi:hypothetical protein [Frankia gtarii]|uniref:hypothetical protein n=1 Tax=Frankia gtarii TaxID=2950102 RepID=UPI0021C1D5D2|nr:hypothetical protein [Frankia gtarii]
MRGSDEAGEERVRALAGADAVITAGIALVRSPTLVRRGSSNSGSSRFPRSVPAATSSTSTGERRPRRSSSTSPLTAPPSSSGFPTPPSAHSLKDYA